MHSNISLICFIITFSLILSQIFAQIDDTIGVRIKNGLINGKRETFDGKELNVFLGIPYAKPPIGDLRFRRPQPTDQWKTPIDAKHWSNACVHQKLHKNYFNQNMSEDCLHLNIWSPTDITSSSDLKPVLFWIHGGGLYYGSAVEEFYSGHVLAAKGDVVVVTFNYRLNIFGFLYSGNEDAVGNMGLWDQVLALEWVNDNIEYFGGDPKRITIAGESAGSMSVSLHIVSPVTQHLFQNAILMSGSSVYKNSICSKHYLFRQLRQYSEINGCSDEDVPIGGHPTQLMTPKIIDCLKNLTSDELISTFNPNMQSCMSMVVIDGQYLPLSPLELVKNNNFKTNFNILLGSVEDEGSLVLPMGAGTGVPYDKNSPPDITYDEAINLLNKIIGQFFIDEFRNYEEMKKIYFLGLSNDTEPDILRKRVGMAIGDSILGCPTILFGKNLFRKDSTIKVYQYFFNSKAGTEKLYCAKWMGVCHFNDVYPLFGLPFTDYDKYEDTEREVSQQMIEIFSGFVRSGRPSSPLSAEWQPFYKIEDKIIAPYYEITNNPKLDTNFGLGLKIVECEYLWAKYSYHNG